MHLQHLSEVFQRLRDAGLKLTPSKCFFAQKQIKYLGHLLDKEGVQPDPAKFKRVRNLAVPTNPSEVKSVLGLFNFFKKFIKNYRRFVLYCSLCSKKTRNLHGQKHVILHLTL